MTLSVSFRWWIVSRGSASSRRLQDLRLLSILLPYFCHSLWFSQVFQCMQWKDTMWSYWKQKHNSSPSTLWCDNAFRIWSHIVLFSYTLIIKHITLLPSKWVRMISLLILSLGFLLICRKRLKNDGLISQLVSLDGREISENLQLPNTLSYYPVWLTHFAGQQSGASLPVAVFWYSPR